MKNNNQAIIRRITGRTLSSDKRRNFFIIAAIMLTTFMIASVFSIGVSYYESINMQAKRMEGSLSHMGFSGVTYEQLQKVYELDYVETVGVAAALAQTSDVPKLENLQIGFVDKAQWEKMFCPTFTNIIGHYAEQENEIMLSRYILEAMGIDNPEIGMEIPFSYVVTGTDTVETKVFRLSCIYTEYSHVKPGGFVAIYTSRAFTDKYPVTFTQQIAVNIIFKDAKRVGENIERLKQDLAFTENQEYVQSPAFNDNYGNTTTYMALIAIVAFLMFTGYLLIYNVMYISVSRDVRFYGMLKTLGTTPRQIRRIVIGQMMRLCMIGLPFGCAASAAVSLWIVPAVISNSGVDTGTVVSFSPVIFIGAILFATLTALFGAITPAKKAANISPVEAVKFTAEVISKPGVRSSANGKPYRMALRNIFRNRKRAAIVMLSLFLGITVCTIIMTIVTSIDVDYRVNNEYKYDYSFASTGASASFLSEDFVSETKKLPHIRESQITTLEFAELAYSDVLDEYVEWLSKAGNYEREFVIEKLLGIGLKGIDLMALEEINERLPVPIDAEAFERGEIALINTKKGQDGNEIVDGFAGVSTFDVIYDSEGNSFQIANGGGVSFDESGMGRTYSYNIGGLEILVSNTFLRQYFPSPNILSFDMNVESSYDGQIYDMLDNTINLSEVIMASRYAARKDIQDAKTIMFVLGGGVSAILGFIGIFNFINVMSVGVMTRKLELATLESIGMSKKQIRSMLRNEGIGYAGITLLCSLTLGNLIAYILFLLFKSVERYALFTYPIIPVFIICAAVSLICLVTPEIVYKGISRMTLVERLREAE